MNQRQLTVQPLLTRLDLHWQGITVARWPALEDVTYVNLLPRHSNGGQQFVKELPCGTHKGPPLLIFVPARSFTNERYVSVLGSFTRDHLVALFGQIALTAIGDFPAEIGQRRHPDFRSLRY
jgi:hypothetical protein